MLVKASAGGGGRGIRPAASADELRTVVAEAQREASSAFGSDAVYLERALQGPKHVEVQVLADTHGDVVPLLRARVLAAAPPPEAGRGGAGAGPRPGAARALCAAAVRLPREVGYVGAGTVEFLVDRSEEFFFIEMNTRIQVEHPVTEWVTGLDLVAEQLRVAGGRAAVGDPGRRRRAAARAIEFRVNAEDPDQDFLPSPGEVTGLELPGGPGVRVDTALDGRRRRPAVLRLAGRQARGLGADRASRPWPAAAARSPSTASRACRPPSACTAACSTSPRSSTATYDITTLETWLADG